MPDADNSYLIDVIGFNDTERLLLSSIFGLAARRDPSFRQRESGSIDPVDLYLVDADSDPAMSEFARVRSRYAARAILIGSSSRGTGLPVLARPIQWARLLQSFDDVMLGQSRLATTGVGIADQEKTLVLRRTNTSAPRTSPPFASAPTGASAAARQPRHNALRPAARQLADAVLVVDDNVTVHRFMEAKLAPYGFRVDFAGSGEEAVGLIGTNEYTCVFLDVVLPGIDGYKVCKLIKSNKQAIKRTAVVMLTGRTSALDKVRGSLAGCDEYLTKPVDENRLLEVIAKFVPSGGPAA